MSTIVQSYYTFANNLGYYGAHRARARARADTKSDCKIPMQNDNFQGHNILIASV
jgi:hypothetical protein